jgi:hypothetical protein
LIKKYIYKFSAVNFFSIFGDQNRGSGLELDPDRYSALKMLDGSGINESGSETLNCVFGSGTTVFCLSSQRPIILSI